MQAHSPVNGHNDPDHGVALLPEVQVRAEQPEPTSTLAHLRVLHFLPDVVGDRELREGGQGGQTVLVVVLVGGGTPGGNNVQRHDYFTWSVFKVVTYVVPCTVFLMLVPWVRADRRPAGM